MVEKQDRIWALYPEYFDARVPRRIGRRVKTELALPGPTLNEMHECAMKLDLTPVKEPEIAYPAFWWRKNGRLLVRQEWSKSDTIRKLARHLVEFRKVNGVPDESTGKDTGKEHSSRKKDKKSKKNYAKGMTKRWKKKKLDKKRMTRK